MCIWWVFQHGRNLRFGIWVVFAYLFSLGVFRPNWRVFAELRWSEVVGYIRYACRWANLHKPPNDSNWGSSPMKNPLAEGAPVQFMICRRKSPMYSEFNASATVAQSNSTCRESRAPMCIPHTISAAIKQTLSFQLRQYIFRVGGRFLLYDLLC